MIWLALLMPALAQDVPEIPVPENANVQTWRPSVDARTTLWADDSTRHADGPIGASMALSYMSSPLVVRWGDDDSLRLVSDVMQMDLMAGWSISGVRVALDVPLYLSAGSELASLAGGGLGDVALDVKGTVLERRDAPLGLAFGLRTSLPTSTVAAPLGRGALAGELQAIADQRFGDLLAVVNVGHRFLPSVEYGEASAGDQLFFRLGAGYALSNAFAVSLDVAGHTHYAASGTGLPLELLVGAHGRVTPELYLRGGLGSGLTQGVGSAASRAIFLVSWQPSVGEGTRERMPRATAHTQVRIVDPDGDVVSGAAVVISSLHVREIGNESFEISLPPDSYVLTAEAEGFLPLYASVRVQPGQNEVVQVMRPDIPFGAITLQVEGGEEPISGTYAIDGGTWESFRNGRAEISLYPGSYSLTVRAEGFLETTYPLVVESGERDTLVVTLQAE